MKVDMNEQGQLVVTPESNLEEMALKCWDETFGKAINPGVVITAKEHPAFTFYVNGKKIHA